MKTELIIMYTWDTRGYYDNKVCGHMYEVIDYFWKLKNDFDAKIVIPDNYDINDILAKYCFTKKEKQIIISSCIPRPKTGIIKTKQGKGLILVTDGNVGNFKGFLYGKVIQFSCGRNGLDSISMNKIKWYLLDDIRLREQSNNYNLKTFPKRYNYNKKIQFDKIKYPKIRIGNYYALFYLTENCRKLNENELNNLISKYKNFGKLLILSDYLEDKSSSHIDIINIKNKPINPFTYNFKNYIYTKVRRQWDCSSRFIPECYFLGINIILEIDYTDLALNVRLNDCKNIESLNLNYDNDIINILKEISND